jgi:hypothetical protein
MNKYIEIFLKEMCVIVDVEYEKMDFKKSCWYLDYEWTNSQQNEFINFIIKIVKENRKIRKYFNLSTVKSIKDFANMFVFQYGWKVKKE